MISAWIAKQGHGDAVVEKYLRKRRELTSDKVDGDPDWGLMFDQILRHTYNAANISRDMDFIFDTLVVFKDGGTR